MTWLSIGKRRLLMKAMILRRVPNNARVNSQLLMEAIAADYELVREKAPHCYFDELNWWLAQEVDTCVAQELIDDGSPKTTSRWARKTDANRGTYRRTKLGDLYLKTLEPDLAELLHGMPMSDVGILDFLSMI